MAREYGEGIALRMSFMISFVQKRNELSETTLQPVFCPLVDATRVHGTLDLLLETER